MKDLKLQVTKWSNTLKYYYLEDYCTSIKLSNSFSQISAELRFEIPYATLSPSILAINIECGDEINLVYKDEQIFAGKVIDMDLKGKDQILSITAYDYCWWLIKSNITKNFDNISVLDALKEIYTRIGATYDIDGYLGENGSIMINSHLVKNKPISKVLNAIYSEVKKVTGVNYYLHTQGDGHTLTITESDRYFSGLTIQPPTSLDIADGNLIDYEINESMSNMVTTIEFYDTTGKLEDDKTIQLEDLGRFGYISEGIEIAEDDTNATKALAEGNATLDEQGKPSEELTLTCFGDSEYKVAHGVMVKIPNTSYYDKFMYIVSSEWTWNRNRTFISKLTLSPSKNKTLEDWSDVEELQESTSSGKSSTGGASSDLVNRILAELKKHIGVKYTYSGKIPSTGMDCSGYIAYVYNQFAGELEITSNDGKLTSQTEVMMGEAKDVTSDFPDNLKECDIIFPHTGHVVAYIGNNEIIEEPSSGLSCRIAPIRWDKVAKVIRVVPDSAWVTASATGDTTSLASGGVSDNLVEFVKGWEAFVSPAEDDGFGNLTIGYGTTAAANPSAVAQGTCTEAEATGWLKDEINQCAKSVTSKLSSIGVSLTQNKYDVLCDMAYNMGSAGFSGLYDLISNSASDSDIVAKIKNYNHANGAVVYGLTKRCNARAEMWTKGDYSGRP